jgi:23S rRNA (uridine2552-2'-O)-methyltransferase
MSGNYDPRDPYFRRAKAEGYLARSVYKLQEIDARYRLLRPGMTVVDLGAAPGSWTQYLLQKLGPTGKVYAIDLQPIQVQAPILTLYQVDVFAPEIEALIAALSVDGIVSDMAPFTTGQKIVDQTRSAALVERSLHLATRWVRPGGFWVAKILEGPDLPHLLTQARATFAQAHVFRSKATRKSSTECFLIGQKRKTL